MEKEIISIVYGNTEEGNRYLSTLRDREESVQQEVIIRVEEILNNIKDQGNKALVAYTNKFDSKNVNENNLCVSKEEIEEAYKVVDEEFIEAIKLAAENIRFFHEKQKKNSWMVTKERGVILGQNIRPLENVGIYVPGGTASYPSSVLMNAIPAKVADVTNVVMVTPPSKDGSINPNILVAADIAGVDKIYKAGGAQAIGALAFGTETIDKVEDRKSVV